MSSGTRLLDLPDKLLGAVVRQLDDGESRLQVFRSSRRLATALLQHTPRIKITYPPDGSCPNFTDESDPDAIEYIDCFPLFLDDALMARGEALQLTLQPDPKLLSGIEQDAAAGVKLPRAALHWLVYSTVMSVYECPAPTTLKICFNQRSGMYYPWNLAYSETLAKSYSCLTSLTFSGLVLALAQLSHLVSDPVLLPQLRHLDVADAKLLTVPDGDQLPVSPFAASQLQSLSISWTSWELLPHLAPLAPHLTQLQASYVCLNALTAKEEEKALVTSNLAAAVSPLTGLQWLHLDLLSDYKVVAALLPLLAQMPSLHTLLLSGSEVEGDAQLDALLALTQLTRLRCFNISDLACSRASAACSWRQLELRDTDWVTAAYLPLHSLTHPLKCSILRQPRVAGEQLMSTLEHNLFEQNKAGVEISSLHITKDGFNVLTYGSLAHSVRTGQHLPYLTVACSSCSSHSGPGTSTSLASNITPGGPGSSSGQRGQQGGSAAAGKAFMQRLALCADDLVIEDRSETETGLSSTHQRTLAALTFLRDYLGH